MYYGATATQDPRLLRRAARRGTAEGGAIGFIEEIDAIATRRGGLLGSLSRHRWPSPRPAVVSPMICEGTGGVVNELLVQMQSFDQPTRGQRLVNRIDRRGQPAAARRPPDQADPAGHGPRSCSSPPPTAPTPSTRRCCARALRPADDLPDPRRARPAQPWSSTSSPGARTSPELAHARHPGPDRRGDQRVDAGDDRAPARRGPGQRRCGAATTRMSYEDVEKARLTEMIGIGHPVTYTEHEQRAHRHPRGRARRHGVAGRPGPHARGAHDRQARPGAGAARALRHRGGLHAHLWRAACAGPDRDGWARGRGAVLRRDHHGAGQRPGGGHPHRRPDGRRGRHDGVAGLLRGDRQGARRGRARRRHGPRRRSRRCWTRRASGWSGCCRATGTSSRRCATPCSSGTSSSGPEITDVLVAASGTSRSVDHA